MRKRKEARIEKERENGEKKGERVPNKMNAKRLTPRHN